MTVVSDASPLVHLARIGELDLLRRLYGILLIPDAVWHEVVIKGEGQPGASEVRSATWIHRRSIANEPLVRILRQTLDAGEAEAIALALESKADLLLMDERLGRASAQHLELSCTGLVGVMLVAKAKGFSTPSNLFWMPCAARPGFTSVKHFMSVCCMMKESFEFRL